MITAAASSSSSIVLLLLILNVILLYQLCNSEVACIDVCRCYERRVGAENDKTYYIVDCSNLGLHTFPMEFPLMATHILLNGNNFENIGIDGNTFGDPGRVLPSIREIYLHNNPNISYIDGSTFDNVRRAHTILLHHTSLTTIPSNLLTGMTYLKYFWINDALLTSIPAGTFDGLSSLVEVYMYGNSLTSLDEGLFKDSPRLREVLVHLNPDLSSPTCCNLCGIPEKAYIRWGNEPDATTLQCGCDSTTICAACTYSSCSSYLFSAASSLTKYSYVLATIAAVSSIFILI